MRRARRTCTVLALLPAPLLVGAAPASAESFFQVETSAAAVHLTVTQEPASSIITASLIDDAVAYAASGFDTGGSSEALAAPAYPGNLVAQGPQLLCSQLFSCPAQPPDYPLLADASYPRRGHDTSAAGGRAMGAGPFVVTPVSAEAWATADNNRAGTQAGRTRLLAGTPGALTIGASSATTALHSAAHRTVVTVTATASDISVAGLIHIASVRSTDRVVVDVGGRPVAHPSIVVSGVTVAGHHATVDNRGLHVDGAGAGDISRQLTQRGVTIRTVGAHHHRTRTGTRSEAVGLSIDVAVPVSGLPYIPNPLPPLPPPFDEIPALPGVNANGNYVGHITIGAVGAAAGVGTQPNFGLGGNLGPGGSSDAGQTTVSPSTQQAPLGGKELVRKLGGSSAAPSIAAPATGPLRAFVDDISKAQLETLYAVLALGTAALFIGWRVTAAARAGRQR